MPICGKPCEVFNFVEWEHSCSPKLKLTSGNKSVPAPFLGNKSVPAPFLGNKSVSAPFLGNKSVPAPFLGNKSVSAPEKINPMKIRSLQHATMA